MATKLKIVEEAPGAPLLEPPEFAPAPSRNTHGWSADRQRKFIEHLALTGAIGEASAER